MYDLRSNSSINMDNNSSWWKKRTHMEHLLIIAIGIIGILAISILTVYLTSLQNKQSDSDKLDEEKLREICNSSVCSYMASDAPELCETPGCIYTASNVLKYMDESVDPCDDFYQFSCGGFLKETTIPDGKSSVDSSKAIKQDLEEQLRAIVEEPSIPNEPKPFKLFKRLYAICMNTSAIEDDAYETLFNSILNNLKGWPVLENAHWNEEEFDWKNFTYESRKLGLTTSTFLSIFIETDSKNSSKRIIGLYEPWLELSLEQFSNGFDDELVHSYYDYMVDVAVILGANRKYAQREMKKALEFEMDLAKITLSQEQRRNITALYNPMPVGELQLKYLDIPWLQFLSNVVNLQNIVITDDEVVDVGVPQYITDLIILLKKTQKSTQANYAIFKIIKTLVPYLTEEIRDRYQQYNEKVIGTHERQARWKECLSTAQNAFDKATGALYVRKYFHKDAKDNVAEMVSDIHAELNKTLEQAEWMDENTRSKALKKAESMSFRIAYPDELLDNKTLEEYYSKAEVDSGNFLTFAMKIALFRYDYLFSRLRKPFDKNEWTTHPPPTIINAMYNPDGNCIYLPAAILQGVFFDSKRPRYMNYGAIGYVIGHEITHGFDDMGRQFDEDGNLQDWWTEGTEKAFLERAKCIIEQYGKLTVPEIDQKVHGGNTQGENIADNGGIKLAYSAYQAWVKRNEPEALLPGLNYTQNQMFWISAANTWCTKTRKETLKLAVSEDSHSPPKFRVTIPFSNTEFFAEDFNCPVGKKMNPKKKCVVW